MSAGAEGEERHVSSMRRDFLRVQKQLTEERCLFLREISALRNQLQSVQLQLLSRDRELQLQQQQQRECNTMDGGSPSGGMKNRFPSMYSSHERNDPLSNSPHVPLTSTLSPGSSIAALPVVAPSPPPATPSSSLNVELMSTKYIADALSSVQLLEDLKELHAMELAARDQEITQIQKQMQERMEEALATWNASLRRSEHDRSILQDTWEHEKDRYKQEALTTVGDELRKERDAAKSLRAETVRLHQDVGLLKKQVTERDIEIRSLRVQIQALQQEKVTAGAERTECRAALLAMSSEKLSLERRLRQTETMLKSGGPNPPRRKNSEAHSSRGGTNFRRISASARSTSRSPPDRTPSTPGTLIPLPTSKSDATMQGLVAFALDEQMAKAVKSGILRAKEENRRT